MKPWKQMPKCNPRAHGATFGCDREARSAVLGSLCMAHYMQQRRGRALTIIESQRKRGSTENVFFRVRRKTYRLLVLAGQMAGGTNRRVGVCQVVRELLEAPRTRQSGPVARYVGEGKRAVSVGIARKAHRRLVTEHASREPWSMRHSACPVAAEIVERWAEERARR